MYISLGMAREHCNITTEVSDALLQLYIDAAEARVASYLNRSLTELLDPIAPPDVIDPAAYAAAIRLAVLYYVADPVSQRESIVIGTISSTLPTVENLLYPYRLGLGV